MRLRQPKPRLAVAKPRELVAPATRAFAPSANFGGANRRDRQRPAAWYTKTKRWRALAKQMRIEAGGMCRHCGAFNVRLVVDHIVEVLDGGAVFDRDNLQVLCYPCHRRKTNAVAKERLQNAGGDV